MNKLYRCIKEKYVLKGDARDQKLIKFRNVILCLIKMLYERNAIIKDVPLPKL